MRRMGIVRPRHAVAQQPGMEREAAIGFADGGALKMLFIVMSTPSNAACQIIWPRNGRTTRWPRPLDSRTASTPVE
jgi:hypothetical protein